MNHSTNNKLFLCRCPELIVVLYAAIHFIITIFYVDIITMVGCQDTNFIHAANVHHNPMFWKNDFEAACQSLGVYQSLSFWFPVVLANVLNISLNIIFKIIFFARPVFILSLFLMIARQLKADPRLIALSSLLLLFGNFALFNLSLTGSVMGVFVNYYSSDFYIFFLAGILFYLRSNLLLLTISVFLGILTHPPVGMMAALFFVGMSFLEKKPVKSIVLLCVGTMCAAGVEGYLLSLSSLAGARLSHDVWWTIFLSNGHLNYLFLFPKSFLIKLILISIFSALVLKLTTNNRIRLAVKCAILCFTVLFAVYLIGHVSESHLIMKLQPLRFSNLLLFVLLFGVSTVEYKKIQSPLFGIIFLIFIGSLPLSIYHKIVLAALLFLIYLLPHYRTAVIYTFCLLMAFVLPVYEAYGTIKENKPFYDAVSFVKKEIGVDKTFLFWGEAPTGHMFRTMTKCKVIDPRRNGSAVYNELLVFYEDDMKKNKCAGAFANGVEDPALVYVQGNNTIARGNLSREKIDCFIREYKIDHILVDSQTSVEEGMVIYNNEGLKIISVTNINES